MDTPTLMRPAPDRFFTATELGIFGDALPAIASALREAKISHLCHAGFVCNSGSTKYLQAIWTLRNWLFFWTSLVVRGGNS